jgi:hypothetical protein
MPFSRRKRVLEKQHACASTKIDESPKAGHRRPRHGKEAGRRALAYGNSVAFRQLEREERNLPRRLSEAWKWLPYKRFPLKWPIRAAGRARGLPLVSGRFPDNRRQWRRCGTACSLRETTLFPT